MHNPALVICRRPTKNEKEEGWRQIKIFQTRVRVEEKITNSVIDNVSVINLVEKEVIDKPIGHLRNFQIPTKLHGLMILSFLCESQMFGIF